MSKASFVREDLVYNPKQWCDIYKVAIVAASFKRGFQLVVGEISQQSDLIINLIKSILIHKLKQLP
jgi:hypothetical protein